MDTNSYASLGMVFYLFALFCAYWAQPVVVVHHGLVICSGYGDHTFVQE
jgi:hypothetical protein